MVEVEALLPEDLNLRQDPAPGLHADRGALRPTPLSEGRGHTAVPSLVLLRDRSQSLGQ